MPERTGMRRTWGLKTISANSEALGTRVNLEVGGRWKGSGPRRARKEHVPATCQFASLGGQFIPRFDRRTKE